MHLPLCTFVSSVVKAFKARPDDENLTTRLDPFVMSAAKVPAILPSWLSPGNVIFVPLREYVLQ